MGGGGGGGGGAGYVICSGWPWVILAGTRSAQPADVTWGGRGGGGGGIRPVARLSEGGHLTREAACCELQRLYHCAQPRLMQENTAFVPGEGGGGEGEGGGGGGEGAGWGGELCPRLQNARWGGGVAGCEGQGGEAN